MDIVVEEIVSLFLIIIVGFYAGKKNIIDEAISRGLSRILLEISTPLLIISSFCFNFTSDIENNIFKAFIYGIAIFVITPILVKPLLIKIKKGKRDILQFAMVFSNCGFMGFPIIQSVFGDEGVIYASIFNMIFNIFVWTYGVMLFNIKNSPKAILGLLKNPGIISAFIGMLIMIFSINIPSIVLDSMKMVGGLTTPIAMLIIGSLLSRTKVKNIFKDKSLYYGSFIKLIIIPLVLFLISNLLNESSIVIRTYILLQAMPAGAMTSLFAESFNKEKEYSALIVSVSTIFSVVTIPLIIKLCI